MRRRCGHDDRARAPEPLGEHPNVQRRSPGSALGGSLAVRRATNATRSARRSIRRRATEDHAADARGSSIAGRHRPPPDGCGVRSTSRAARRRKIRALTTAAAGIRPERGDAVSVEASVRRPGFGGARDERARLGARLRRHSAAGADRFSTASGVAAFTGRPLIAVRDASGPKQLSLRGVVRERSGRSRPNACVENSTANRPHVAAAVISALPAATAAAVLELYDPTNAPVSLRRLAPGPTRRACTARRAHQWLSYLTCRPVASALRRRCDDGRR